VGITVGVGGANNELLPHADKSRGKLTSKRRTMALMFMDVLRHAKRDARIGASLASALFY
jgi:hypothetical protein